MQTKQLFILRGLPGAGKTTLAKFLGGDHIEADMFFEHPIRGYEFDASKLKEAHEWCRRAVESAMSAVYHSKNDSRIVVSNTFTQEWEMQPYIDMAEEYGFRAYTLVVENRHNGINTHRVPEETIEKMRNRFQIKL